jgi:hypothetical protein
VVVTPIQVFHVCKVAVGLSTDPEFSDDLWLFVHTMPIMDAQVSRKWDITPGKRECERS